MGEPVRDRRLRAGSMIIFAMAIVFMAFSVFTILTPLRGEEAYAGVTFSELQASNPELANIIWHYTTAIAVIVFGVMVLIAFLAWKTLPRGSRFAWYAILLLGLTFVAALILAHVPIRHPGLEHWGPPVILTAILLVGLAVAAKPVLSQREST